MQIEKVTAFLYALKPRGIRFGLENTRLVLDRLGRPQDRFEVVHIAGSNGKGSTAAFLESILLEHGMATGLYTSPHLKHYRERFRVGGRWVADRVIEDAMDVMLKDGLELDPLEISAWISEHELVGKMKAGSWYSRRGEASQFCRLTFFECTTILATIIFARLGVDLAVMECGMGGRLDATNVFEPLVSVITPVSLEHTEWLGEDLATIAGEKAGIIKKAVPVVCAVQAVEAGRVIAGRAQEVGAPLRLEDRDFRGHGTWEAASFTAGNLAAGPLRLGLAGRHQMQNAAMAVGCAAELRLKGFAIDESPLAAGLSGVEWPARFERFGRSGEWIVDGAHNPDGIRALVELVQDIYRGERLRIVFAVLGEKDVEPMLRVLESVAAEWHLVRPLDARGRDPETYAGLLGGHCKVHRSVPEALESLQGRDGPPVLVTGSLTIAGEARDWLVRKLPRREC